MAAMDWIVVKVVVRDRTEGAGDENVLSPPFLPFAVLLVPATEDAKCEGAWIDGVASCSVDTVWAAERGGAMPSTDECSDARLGPEEASDTTPV